MASSPPGYLLDTNILVHLIRGKAVGQAIDAHFGLRAGVNRCAIAVVTAGELFSLARKWRWGAQKVQQFQQLLSQIVSVDINHPDILQAYGELDHFSDQAGRPMGKNDVWIVAVAKASGMTLL